MTRVRIPGPDIEADITAEQLADYSSGLCVRDLLVGIFGTYSPSDIARWILARAKEEGRHPSAVLADIEGPVRGVEGRACGGAGLDERTSRARCAMRAATERHARQLRNERAAEDSTAPHGADEGSE